MAHNASVRNVRYINRGTGHTVKFCPAINISPTYTLSWRFCKSYEGTAEDCVLLSKDLAEGNVATLNGRLIQATVFWKMKDATRRVTSHMVRTCNECGSRDFSRLHGVS